MGCINSYLFLASVGVPMIAYPKRKDTPSRMQRKRMRNEVFWKNYKETKLRKKQRLIQKRQNQEQAESFE